ncbi:MAG: hypothetical protein ACLFVW_07240, partial [Phycisphaerae bacterium]
GIDTAVVHGLLHIAGDEATGPRVIQPPRRGAAVESQNNPRADISPEAGVLVLLFRVVMRGLAGGDRAVFAGNHLGKSR